MYEDKKMFEIIKIGDHIVRLKAFNRSDLFIDMTNRDVGPVDIRISCEGGSFVITSTNGTFSPWSVNGLPAFVVNPKRRTK